MTIVFHKTKSRGTRNAVISSNIVVYLFVLLVKHVIYLP